MSEFENGAAWVTHCDGCANAHTLFMASAVSA
jgi:hypothetical protein